MNRARARVIVLSAAAIAASVLAVGAATAQNIREVPRHEGFWMSFGAGGGTSDRVNDSFGRFGRKGGVVYGRLGGTVNQNFLVGGEVTVWFRDSRFSYESRTNAMVTVLFYPAPATGAFIKGGFGFASHDRQFGDYASGLGTVIGGGIDFKVARNLYITPNVDLMVQTFDNDTNGTLLFALGVTWH